MGRIHVDDRVPLYDLCPLWLIVGACAEPFAEKAAAEENGKKKKARAKGFDTSLLARNIGIGFTVVVVLTLCGNLYAASKADAPGRGWG